MTEANALPAAPTISRTGIVSAWRWWMTELRAMLPATMARWIDGDRVAPNVSIDELGLTIIQAGSTPARPLNTSRVPLDALASSPALRELIAAGRERVRLVLTPDQAMVKSITLPMATEESLRDVVGFELDRHTPFTPDQAYYDARIVSRDLPREKIVVTLVVASKAEVATLTQALVRAGLICEAIGIDAAAASNAADIDLQSQASKPPRRLSREHQIHLGLLGLAALLAVTAVVLPLWQKREAIKVLIPQAEKTSADFQLSERVYSEYTKLTAEYNFLATKKHSVYPVVSVVEELAQTFPDSTWVQKLDIKPNGKVREVIILGEAQSASKVIENLEQSPSAFFQNSKQQSQTMQLQPTTQRFHVSAEIKPRPIPAAVGFEDVAPESAALTPSPIAPAAPAAASNIVTPAAGAITPPGTMPPPIQPPPSATAPSSPANSISPDPIKPRATSPAAMGSEVVPSKSAASTPARVTPAASSATSNTSPPAGGASSSPVTIFSPMQSAPNAAQPLTPVPPILPAPFAAPPPYVPSMSPLSAAPGSTPAAPIPMPIAIPMPVPGKRNGT